MYWTDPKSKARVGPKQVNLTNNYKSLKAFPKINKNSRFVALKAMQICCPRHFYAFFQNQLIWYMFSQLWLSKAFPRFVRVFVWLGPHIKSYWCTWHIEIFAQAIDKIARIAFRQLIWIRAHNYKTRWPSFGLGHISQLDTSASRCWRRMRLEHASQPVVQLRCCDTPVPYLVRF